MRIECPHCERLGAALIIELGDRRAVFQCVQCRRSVVANEWGGIKRPETVVTGLACPKCGACNSEAAKACRSCGLAMERFVDFTKMQPSFDPPLEEAWAELLGSWHEDALHESFLAEVARSSDYNEAARRYRLAADEPGRAAKAQEALSRIQNMAAAALLSSRPKVEPAPEPFRAVVMLLIVLVVLAGAGGVYAMMKKGSAPAEEPGMRPGPTTSPPVPLRKRAPPAIPKSSPQGGAP